MKLPDKPKPRCTDLSKYKFLIYGDPGSGKSTLASKFPDAIFIPTEPGLNYLEVNQITDDDGNPKIVKNWTEFCQAIRLLCTEKHQFKTIIIDTIDNAFEFCAIHTLQLREIEHESDEGFGKGWNIIKREFTKVINYVANYGIGLVFISHEKQGERESKGVKRMYIDSSLSNQPKSYVNGLVDFIFYCYQDNEHKRMMQTKATPNVNAKDRTGHLPPVMAIDYEELLTQLQLAFQKDPTSAKQADIAPPPTLKKAKQRPNG
jgi:hypothetical protein